MYTDCSPCAAGHARVSGEPYVLLDRSLEEVVKHIAKDLDGRIQLGWPVTKVITHMLSITISGRRSHRNAAGLCVTSADHSASLYVTIPSCACAGRVRQWRGCCVWSRWRADSLPACISHRPHHLPGPWRHTICAAAAHAQEGMCCGLSIMGIAWSLLCAPAEHKTKINTN